MTVKPLLDTRYKNLSGSYPVVVCVRAGDKVRYLKTGYKVKEKDWAAGKVVKSHDNHRAINARVEDLIHQVRQYENDCIRASRPFQIARAGISEQGFSFNDYLLHREKQYEKKEMFVMAAKTKRIGKEIDECFGSLYFDELDQDKLRDYEAWLIARGNDNNTRHKKFKFLQQFYSQAVEDGKANNPNPFKQYKIPVKPVRKEKLTTGELKALEEVSLKPGTVNDARNLFLFSYYCKGARFENCIMFRKYQIANGRCEFRTNKGNKYLSVKIHSRLKKILDQYPGEDFIFPYVKEIPDSKKEYIKLVDVRNVIVNRNLKIAAKLAGIKKPVTFHIARHSFAYHLKAVTNSIHVISDSLGHSRSSITEVYLKVLDDTILDVEVGKLYGE